jgi:hypothetical protein
MPSAFLRRKSAHCVLAWHPGSETVSLYYPDLIKVIESYSYLARCKQLLQIGIISKFIEPALTSITLWITLAHNQPLWMDTT